MEARQGRGGRKARTGRATRRRFLARSAVAFALGPPFALGPRRSDRAAGAARGSVRVLTRGDRHHFFGYYGICPWNGSETKLLCLETTFQDRLPEPGEPAVVGLVDARTGAFTPVAETRAWNFQQGAMLHWSPRRPEREIIFNDRRGREVAAVVMDLATGRRRVLSRPVSAVGHRGRFALSLTYGRLARLRKVVGYSGLADPNPEDPAPANDGVFLIDLAAGTSRLVVSLAEVYERLRARFPRLAGRHLWFNHTVFNTSDTRFLFLARAYLPPGRVRHTAMFTANTDGSDLREVIPFDRSVSHFDWRNDREILATFRVGSAGRRHVLFTDGAADWRVLGRGFLDFDGHASFAPDGRRIATDRKRRRTLEQSLLVYDVVAKTGQEVCRLPMLHARYLSGDVRCDFHPRWNRAGTAICFDALEKKTGTRQLHVAAVTGP